MPNPYDHPHRAEVNCLLFPIGIGNVLLGDDAIGPHVIQLLESSYTFAGNVEIADLVTPALDLTHRIAGRDRHYPRRLCYLR